MATQTNTSGASAGAPAAEPSTADPNLFADLAAAGVELAADEGADDAGDGASVATPVAAAAAGAAPAPVPAAAAPVVPAPEVSKAEARAMLTAAKSTLSKAQKIEGRTKAEIVEGLRTKPAETLRDLGMTVKEFLAAVNPADTGDPAEPTTEDRVAQLEAKRVEDEKRAATDRARAEADEEGRQFEKSKLATIEAVKNQRVAGANGQQVEAYPRINHTGSHELVVELMLAFAESRSPRDAKGNIIPETMKTLPRDEAAKHVEKYLADMGVPAMKPAAPAARPGARPAVPAPKAPAAPAAPAAPVVTAKDTAASYEAPAEEIENFEQRKAAVFKELNFEIN